MNTPISPSVSSPPPASTLGKGKKKEKKGGERNMSRSVVSHRKKFNFDKCPQKGGEGWIQGKGGEGKELSMSSYSHAPVFVGNPKETRFLKEYSQDKLRIRPAKGEGGGSSLEEKKKKERRGGRSRVFDLLPTMWKRQKKGKEGAHPGTSTP